MSGRLSKGKRIDNGQWIEGYYRQKYDDFEVLEHIISYSKSARVWGDIKIDPNTLCDDTGLHDKNFTPIWENDVVNITYKNLSDSRCRVAFVSGRFVGIDADGCEVHIDENNTEVIGNIFDNYEFAEELTPKARVLNPEER